jgi:protein-L-isoaspartate(D-aspartate) O-methyltransferase
MRRRLVAHLRRAGYVRDRQVMEAFLTVPREAFLPELAERSGLGAVYRDEAIVTRRDTTNNAPLSSSSQPAIMALMLEMLDVRAGHRVVEIGAGTGYNAAILALLAGDQGLVVSIEIDVETALAAARGLREIESAALVVVADGIEGLPGFAARGRWVDRWMVTASTKSVPRPWHDQLVPGGRLVVPLRLSDEADRAHAVAALVKVTDGFDSVAVTPGGFMPLRMPDGTTFEPAPAAVVAAVASQPKPPKPESPAPEPPSKPRTAPAPEVPLTQGPIRDVRREQVENLRIAVRYTDDPPDMRWVFPRGDHWIGVSPSS